MVDRPELTSDIQPSLVVTVAAIFLLAAVVSYAGQDASENPTAPERVEVPGIENVFRLSPRLYSGAQPEGAEGFAELKRLGIKSLISVDGSRPDVEAARRLGLRYVHLPIGYDGVPNDQAVRLVKALKDLPGPVFIHCHHGMHRGPAAAAVCEVATEGWDRAKARAWLEQAGTDPKYRGLFTSVDQFVPPTVEELNKVGDKELPERAEVSGLVDAMVRIDEHWDRLKTSRSAGFRPPPGRPELDPGHEALMLTEQFREAARDEEAKTRGADFLRLLDDAERDSASLLTVLSEPDRAKGPGEAEAVFARVEQRCAACHSRFRDRRER